MNRDDDAVEGEVVDPADDNRDKQDAWGKGWGDDEYHVDPNASPTVDGKLDAMGKDLRRLTRASLVATLCAGGLLALTDLWNGAGFHTSIGFVVGGGLSTLNLWILAGGYFAIVDKRAAVPRLLLSVVGSMVVMFGVALYVIFAKREWTLGFALGLAVPALGGILYGVTAPKRDDDAGR
jgi:hypothetical protein